MEKEYVDKCTVYSAIVGSTAYGTNTPESDVDVRGIAVLDDPKFYFGYLDRFEQFEDKVNDIVIYDIRKAFTKIRSLNNPHYYGITHTMLTSRNILEYTIGVICWIGWCGNE